MAYTPRKDFIFSGQALADHLISYEKYFFDIEHTETLFAESWSKRDYIYRRFETHLSEEAMSDSGPRRLFVVPFIPIRTRASKRLRRDEDSDSTSHTASGFSARMVENLSKPSDKPIATFSKKPPLGFVSERVSIERRILELPLIRDNGSPSFDDEGFLNDREACKAVSRALARNPKDLVAVRRMTDHDLAGAHAQMITAVLCPLFSFFF